MSDDEFIPERLQRILERIERLIAQTEKLSVPVAVRPDVSTIRIFVAIENGAIRFEDIQNQLGIARNILTDQLSIMVKLGILKTQMYSETPKRYEYFINTDDDDGPSGQPALVPM
jgi:hypothetical protein